MYSKVVMEHFKNPKNVGKMKNPDGIGKVGNIKCGDIMYFYIKVVDDKKTKLVNSPSANSNNKNSNSLRESHNTKKKISDVKFETFGCVTAIANSSLLTTMTKGKTIDDALKITKDDIIKKFGNVPCIKIHCSLLAIDALHEAIYDYFLRNKLTIPKTLQEDHERTQKTLSSIEKAL